MRRITGMLVGLLAWTGALAQAPAPAPIPPEPAHPVPDYAAPASWLCRPGVDDGTCSKDLDALAIDAAGKRTPINYTPAKDPGIDCFYVYPTVSLDPSTFSDMIPGPEERRTTHAQAARLGSVCRLFVPIYQQYTITALRREMAKGIDNKTTGRLDFDTPYRDILAAWRAYLKNDNKGRGVILLGHSQGAIILKRLLAEEIDGKPVQKRMIGAYLAGNLDLTTASLKNIPPCKASGQTGCLVAWSDYRDGDTSLRRVFGAAKPGDPAICVNPAAPAGGRAMLKAYLPNPTGTPPFIENLAQLSAECVTDAQGTVLSVRIEPGPLADILRVAFDRFSAAPGWGLHPLDMSLVQGNVIDMITAQSAAWPKR